MPALHSIRMERFCRYFLETGVAAQAYLKAGYKANSRNTLDAAASRLTRSVKVKARIRELQGNMVTRNRVTVDSLVEELTADREHARRLDQPATAVSATMAVARLTGLLVDRKETGAPGDFAGLQNEAQVIELVKAELGDEAAQQLLLALAAVDQVRSTAEITASPEEVDPLPIEPTTDGNTTLN